MARDVEAHKTGDKGELMAELLLSEVARVNPYKKDIGLDFMCELRAHAGVMFYIQAKGSSTPAYTETTISSLPIECKTIEEYWFMKRDPVFLLMSDVTANKTYYLLVARDTYRPRCAGQKTYTFSIPLSNEITRENIGNFVVTVMRNQRNVSQEEVERFLEEHYEKNPELYHDLDEIDRFLEVMRGSDQEAQFETKMLLRQRNEAGVPISQKLRQGLISIFISCKDRITQSHVLDALLFTNERSVIPEILKQVERNLRLYEYRWSDESRHHTYISFLFNALVRFKATNILEELNYFMRIKDININRCAIRASGELKVHGTIPSILRSLGHPDDGVRYDVAQALSKLGKTKVNGELNKILKISEDNWQITGAIETLAKFKNAKAMEEVLSLAESPSRDIRKAVALYLGEINPLEHMEILLRLMVDDDHKVRSEAIRSVSKSLPVKRAEFGAHKLSQNQTIKAEKLERLVLPLLKDKYENGEVLSVISLLSFCKGSQSLPTLLYIYRNEKGSGKNFELAGPTGDVEGIQYIDLKTAVLEILKQYNLSEINDDVVQQIELANIETRHKYIIVAGEMKLEAAFEPLIKILGEENLEDRNWTISSLVNIDALKSRIWAVSTLRSNPSLELSLICFEIFQRLGIEKEEDSLIKEQVIRLMNQAEVRQDVRIYNYIDRYNVSEVIPLIVNDLRNGRIEFSLAYTMIKTLALFKTPEGRDLAIYALKIAEGGYQRLLIEVLGNIGDSESISVVREYSDHPDPDISKLVERILSRTSNV